MLGYGENGLAVEAVFSEGEFLETSVVLEHLSEVDSGFLSDTCKNGIVDIQNLVTCEMEIGKWESTHLAYKPGQLFDHTKFDTKRAAASAFFVCAAWNQNCRTPTTMRPSSAEKIYGFILGY